MAELTLDDFCQDEIYVLDTETTGLRGAPDDVVVDIGITKVSLSKGTVKDVYSSVVGYDVEEWNDYRRNAWIFENTDLTLRDVSSLCSRKQELCYPNALLHQQRRKQLHLL